MNDEGLEDEGMRVDGMGNEGMSDLIRRQRRVGLLEEMLVMLKTHSFSCFVLEEWVKCPQVLE